MTDDCPFALPPRELITHVVHFPMPISVNKIWRPIARKMIKSQEYLAWIKAADAFGIYMKVRGKCIKGPFAADVILDRNERGRADLDNFSFKCVLDRAQAWGLILNDRNAERLSSAWGIAPHGCKLTLMELA